MEAKGEKTFHPRMLPILKAEPCARAASLSARPGHSCSFGNPLSGPEASLLLFIPIGLIHCVTAPVSKADAVRHPIGATGPPNQTNCHSAAPTAVKFSPVNTLLVGRLNKSPVYDHLGSELEFDTANRFLGRERPRERKSEAAHSMMRAEGMRQRK